MQTISLQALPDQQFKTVLNGQNCVIRLRQINENLYFSVSVNAVLIVSNVICRDRVKLIPSAYMPFDGNLMFVDQKGTSDPVYSGLTDRFVLVYMTSDEIG